MTKVGWEEKSFPAELRGQMYECDICGKDVRKRETKVQRGHRVCEQCFDNDPKDREDE